MGRLTKNSEESTLYEIMGSDVYFSIPLFQRLYVWQPKLIDELVADFERVCEEDSDHFLGAIISHHHVTSSAQSARYELIDGQQRLTTIFLFLCAVVRVLSLNKEAERAADYAEKYLFLRKRSRHGTNAKLHPSLYDRAQLNRILADIAKQPDLKKEMKNFEFIPMSAPTNASTEGKLRANYNKFLNFLKLKIALADGSTDPVKDYLDKVLMNCSMVEIVIEDVATGPNIYDRMNGGQNPMTIGDLVRNGIFSRVASSADEMVSLEETYWRPFYEGFRDGKKYFFDEYFFPYGLTVDQNLKKNDTYSRLQKEWSLIEKPTEIIENLKKHQDCFMDLKTGSNRQKLSKNLFRQFKKLPSLNAPASTFPFIMQLLLAFQDQEIDEECCIEVMKTIETFLVRRAVCGIEPTGLHAVFKRLWKDLDGEISAIQVKAKIKTHKTVQWPSNADFSKNIEERHLADAGICNFLLNELNADLGGDEPETKLTIEHILPQKLKGKWHDHFNLDQYESLVHTLANLIPLSSPMNARVQNADYAIKRQHFSQDSVFKAARKLSEDYAEWTPETIKKRAAILAEWALERWPN